MNKNVGSWSVVSSCRAVLSGICVTAIFLTMFTGCADRKDVELAEKMTARTEGRYSNLPTNVALLLKQDEMDRGEFVPSKSDILYLVSMMRSKADYLVLESRKGEGIFDFYNGKEDKFADEVAFLKRKNALVFARSVYTYKFEHYCRSDGVSAFIYNLAYLSSVPHKLLRGLRCSDGLFGYVGNVFKLILGAVAALFGLFLATIAGVFCHPLQTLANCTLGLFYFDGNWWTYVFNTNFVASLWDVIWGAVIYPIWQALVFWL